MTEWTTEELLRTHVRCVECGAESRAGFRTPSARCPTVSNNLPGNSFTRDHNWVEIDS
jgi:hypothetical protein